MDFEKAVKLEEREERKAEIKSRLADYEDKDLLSFYRQANAYDGSFDFVDVFDPEDIDDYMGDSQDGYYRLLCAVVFGNVDNVNDYLRFNAYGNLESVSEYELQDDCKNYLDDLADWIIDYWWQIDYSICEEDKELLQAWEYGYDEEDEEEESED